MCYGTDSPTGSPSAQPTASPIDGLCCGCTVETLTVKGCVADAACNATIGAKDAYCVTTEWDLECTNRAKAKCLEDTSPAPTLAASASTSEDVMDDVWKVSIVILVMAILVISCFCVLLRIRRMYREHDRKRKIMRRNSEKYKRQKKLRRKKSLERAKTDGLYEKERRMRKMKKERAKYHGIHGVEDGVEVDADGVDDEERVIYGIVGAPPMRVQTESTFRATSPSMNRTGKVRRVMSGKGARSRSPPRGMYPGGGVYPGQSHRVGGYGYTGTTNVVGDGGVHSHVYRETHTRGGGGDEDESGSEMDEDEDEMMKGLNRLQSVKRHSI